MNERQRLEQAIRALEGQRGVLGDDVVEASLAALREKLASLTAAASELERRQVTILFVDIVGSSKLGEKLDPEVVMEIMDGALKRFVAIVQEHRGEVARLMGDGLLAFFGARETQEDDAQRAVQAGLQVISAGKSYAASLGPERGREQFAVRVGINTGLVALGEVGGQGGSEFTAMGDPINLAARLEQSAPENGLLISQNTYRQVRGLFETVSQAPLSVKGKEKPVQTYLVIRPSRHAFRMATRGVDASETRLVGREAELAALQTHYQKAMGTSSTQLLTLVGEAGIGKSRLLFEFEQWLAARPDQPLLFKARATPASQSVPFGLFRELFAFRFGILETDGKTTVMEKFRSGVGRHLVAERADLVGHFIGFDFSESQAVGPLLGSADFRQLALAYLAAYFRQVAAQPAAIFLEDIHWADESSLDLLADLVAGLPGRRLLIACLARPTLFERRPNWGTDQGAHQRIDLKPLSRESSRALVEQILQRVKNLPASLRESIVNSAEGNPFYVEELINILLDEGIIKRHEPHWLVVTPDIDAIKIPGTLRGVLHARLDHLPAAEKGVLQRASIVGRIFWDTVLEELAADDDSLRDVAGQLTALRSREMVYRRDRSTIAHAGEYIFKHAMLRDAVYETVLLRQRQRYHEQVARWLERHVGERVTEYLALIAQHYEMAGQRERAARYLSQSGRALLNVGAAREGQNLLERALALLPETGAPEDRAAISVHLGHAFYQGGDMVEAERFLKAGFRLADEIEAAELQSEALGYLAGVAQRRGNYAEAADYDEQALARARETNNLQQIASALHGLCTSRYLQDEYESSASYADQALQSSREIGNRRGEALALNMLGLLAGERGQVDVQTAYYQQALTVFRQIGDLARGAMVLNNLGSAAYHGGEYEAAVRHTGEALEILEELGQTYFTAFTLVSRGLAYAALDQRSQARKCHCRALQIAQEIHAEQVTLFALVGMADLHAAAGEFVPGAELLGLVLNQPGVTLDIRRDAEKARQGLRDALGEADFEAALAAGAGQDLEQVVEQYLGDCPAGD